jgi:hypothetical protein
MTNDEAVKIVGKMMAQSISERMVQILLTACNRESELAAEAMVEKFKKTIIEVFPPEEYGEKEGIEYLYERIESLSPSGVLEEALRQARLEEAEMWNSHCLKDYPPQPPGWAAQRLASLRQPTAEKEEANDRLPEKV